MARPPAQSPPASLPDLVPAGAPADQRTPYVRDQLPFRVLSASRLGHPIIHLEYDGIVCMPDGHRKKIPYLFEVGNIADMNHPNAHVANPLGLAILRMMQMYCQLEDQVVPIVKERDQLQAEVVGLQAELHRLEKSNSELERLLDQQKANNSKGGRR